MEVFRKVLRDFASGYISSLLAVIQFSEFRDMFFIFLLSWFYSCGIEPELRNTFINMIESPGFLDSFSYQDYLVLSTKLIM